MAEEEKQAPKKKLPLGLILLGVQLVFLLGGIGFVAKTALNPGGPSLNDRALLEKAIISVKEDSAKITVVNLDDFSVNLPQSAILKAQIQVEVSNPETAELVKTRISAIKAQVLEVLASQSKDRTSTLQGKLLLKDAIREAINTEIRSEAQGIGLVRDVYFIEFLLM